MNKVKHIGLVAAAVLAILSSGCGAAEAPTVDEVVEHQVEAAAAGTPCEFTWISSDIQHRLNHYRVCIPEIGQEQQQTDALQDALDDCFGLCDESFGFGTEEGISCTQQCKAE